MDANTKKITLILGVNIEGYIVQFNNECEHLTGLKREEVLQKKLWDVVIPPSSRDQTKQRIDTLVKSESIGEFILPLKTRNGTEIMVSWTSYPSKDKNGKLKDICFIGTTDMIQERKERTIPVPSVVSEEENIQSMEKNLNIETKLENRQIYSPRDTEKMRPTDHKENVVFKQAKRHTILEKRLSPEFEKIKKIKQEQIVSTKPRHEPMDVKSIETTTGDVWKKYEELTKKLKELEKKDLVLERQNMILEKNVKQLMLQIEKQQIIWRKTQKTQIEKSHEKEITKQPPSSKSLGFFQDPLGTKKRRMEFEQQIQILDERKKEMDASEANQINERKQLDKRIAELGTWKEKLILLEDEIERRQDALEEQERKFLEKKHESEISTSIDSPVEGDTHHGILDKIPQSAAIIQRGVLKQINNLFACLLGFEPEEIVNKSLFDFIAPEGLAEIEQYYLNRLQGNSSSMYETVFSTKNNDKISVEVNIKQTMYHGEKAEIVIMTVVEKKDTDMEPVENPIEKPSLETLPAPVDEQPRPPDNEILN